MGRKNAGFTLVELVVVILILGILSAVAIPKFIQLEVQARTASIEGLSGAVNSAALLAHALWVANGDATSTSVTMDGQAVVMNGTGYPTADAAGIGAAVTFSAADYALVGNLFQLQGAPTEATCAVSYDAATGTATVLTAGCS